MAFNCAATGCAERQLMLAQSVFEGLAGARTKASDSAFWVCRTWSTPSCRPTIPRAAEKTIENNRETVPKFKALGIPFANVWKSRGHNPALITLNFSHIHLNRNRVPRDQTMSRPS
jgi:hypothetical protein